MAFRERYPPSTPMVVGGLEEIRIIEADNEVYIADNYLGGRVLVFDLDTLEFKRVGAPTASPWPKSALTTPITITRPMGPCRRFRRPPDAQRLQRRSRIRGRPQCQPHPRHHEGRGVPGRIHHCTATGAGGSTGGVAFSHDPEQRYLYISDLTNNRIWLLNRADGTLVGEMGTMADNGGQFYGLHMIAVDSRGTSIRAKSLPVNACSDSCLRTVKGGNCFFNWPKWIDRGMD